uniref:WD domain-containing protein, G-beta repeat-containing protein n=1 Tax=Candidatus Kentrum sp. MB TaxID=2138164 RepID=A0A451B9S2_9GAMM|nr:MAG: WD domain-containing protein, G-beta repeat-containing protein [Candidatus Kentron sp. MB]VFK75044.1 MAG: WD domain-containing protein, G-beta repeat-containing protein [Candidatus Kentron sp. MB]
MSQPNNHSPHPALTLRHTLRGHTEKVYRMALSPDGRYLASPSQDGTIRFWDMENGQLFRTLRNEGTPVCVAWSPDGVRLASGGSSRNKQVSLWDIATGKRIRILGKHGGMVYSVAWSPNGRLLASCSGDRIIQIWEPESGQLLRELRGHTNQVEGIVWSPDSKQLCSGSWDNTLLLWDVASGETVRTLDGHKGPIKSVAWSPDGQAIASGSHDRTVRIRDLETGQQQIVLEGHISEVVSVVFLDEGRLLTSLGENGRLILWRTENWVKVKQIEWIGAGGLWANLAVHPTLPMMAVRGLNKTEINIWDLDFDLLRDVEVATSTVFYVNAKAVLLGDSGVGKSGLGIRMAEQEFRQTESTHGARFWHFPTDQLTLPSHIQAELTLWDLAG